MIETVRVFAYPTRDYEIFNGDTTARLELYSIQKLMKNNNIVTIKLLNLNCAVILTTLSIHKRMFDKCFYILFVAG